jgi:hypothetical protein
MHRRKHLRLVEGDVATPARDASEQPERKRLESARQYRQEGRIKQKVVDRQCGLQGICDVALPVGFPLLG